MRRVSESNRLRALHPGEIDPVVWRLSGVIGLLIKWEQNALRSPTCSITLSAVLLRDLRRELVNCLPRATWIVDTTAAATPPASTPEE